VIDDPEAACSRIADQVAGPVPDDDLALLMTRVEGRRRDSRDAR
jgi:hypothetical protein